MAAGHFATLLLYRFGRPGIAVSDKFPALPDPALAGGGRMAEGGGATGHLS
jgi:hypothetical protein